MGCCQDKGFHTSKGQAKKARSEKVQEEDTEGVDVDSSDHREPKSNKSLLITVLWRRLSMFSRRDSTPSNKRQSVHIQKHGCTFQESNPEGILEEPEKG